METKQCNKCNKIKFLNEFSYRTSTKDNLEYFCKECRNESQRIFAATNRKKISEYRKAYNKLNNKDVCKKRRDYYVANIEKKREWIRVWRKANPEKVKRYRQITDSRRCSTLMGRLRNNISTAIRISLNHNKKGAHWECLVGYTLDDLKKHLEKQFKDGMSWDNRGKYGWHIDHIIPISVFNFEKPEDDDFKKCWALSNLRPMWAKENLSKNNRLEKHFQPKLIFK